jgi:hypothetical protein
LELAVGPSRRHRRWFNKFERAKHLPVKAAIPRREPLARKSSAHVIDELVDGFVPKFGEGIPASSLPLSKLNFGFRTQAE